MFLVVIEEWGMAAGREVSIFRSDLSVYKEYVIYRTLMDCYDHPVHLPLEYVIPLATLKWVGVAQLDSCK